MKLILLRVALLEYRSYINMIMEKKFLPQCQFALWLIKTIKQIVRNLLCDFCSRPRPNICHISNLNLFQIAEIWFGEIMIRVYSQQCADWLASIIQTAKSVWLASIKQTTESDISKIHCIHSRNLTSQSFYQKVSQTI